MNVEMRKTRENYLNFTISMYYYIFVPFKALIKAFCGFEQEVRL